MFGYFTCLGVGLRQTYVVQFIVALCLWRRMNTFERMKGQNRVIKSFHRTAIAWPGVGSCPERDLHCGAELLQRRRLWRRSHGRCHRAGVVLQVVVRSCLSRALQSAGLGESFGEQQPRDPLGFGNVPIWSRRHQGGEPAVGSGFQVWKCREITSDSTSTTDSSDFFDPQHLCLLDSGSNLQSKNYIENMHLWRSVRESLEFLPWMIWDGYGSEVGEGIWGNDNINIWEQF